MSEQKSKDDAARAYFDRLLIDGEVFFDPTPTEVRIFNPSTGTWSQPMPIRPQPKNLDSPDVAG